MAQLNVAEKSDDVHVHDEHGRQFWALTLGAVGVVYGDIGTSPLYAFREAVIAARGDGLSAAKPCSACCR